MNYEKAREIMVDTQVRPNDVSDPVIVSAFLKTPREAFVPTSRKSVAYSELEIETSEGRALWTPRDTGKLVKLANIKPSDIVLVVGAGSGYEAALISHLAETVIALEDDESRVDAMSDRFTALGIDQAVAVAGDRTSSNEPSSSSRLTLSACFQVREGCPATTTTTATDGTQR